MTHDDRGQETVGILRVDASGRHFGNDQVAIEEPLEIRIEGTDPVITMRTPGHDRELVAGLLLSEGLVDTYHDLDVLSPRLDSPGVFQVRLRPSREHRAGLMQRSSLSNSACGVCGKKKLNLDLMVPVCGDERMPLLSDQLLCSLPGRLRQSQQLFEATGGLHAAALFGPDGTLIMVMEDIGRHNALDKLIGWALLAGLLPLENHIIMLSGRASFELIQKCTMARAPVVCAVSAPSSFAVSLAERYGITLLGFLRGERFNVYAHPERLAVSGSGEVDRGEHWSDDRRSSFTMPR